MRTLFFANVTQLTDGHGSFNVDGLARFSFAVVSVMGPQSSGTILSQTTKGILMAKCANIEPCTLVMDLEGTDGRERGEVCLKYTYKSFFFALSANKPLLKTVFQVMMRLFSPRKSILLFVIRDKTRTPLENWKPFFREYIQKIWDNVPKPQAHKDKPLSKFFNVEVTALNSYEEKEEQFKEQVAALKQRFYHSIAPGELAGDRRAVVPASGMHNKYGKLSRRTRILTFLLTRHAAVSDTRGGIGATQDVTWKLFEESVRTAKKQNLETRLLQLVQPAYHSVLGHLRSKTLDDFKDAFEKALNGGEAFSVAAHDCTQSFIAEFGKGCAGKLNKALAEPVESFLDAASNETWPSIRNLLQRETKIAVSGFTGALSGFDINASTLDKMVANLERYRRGVVETKAREEAGRVLIRMRTVLEVVLCVMAVLRLEEDADNIENTLALALVFTNANKKVTSPFRSIRNPLRILVIFVDFLLVKAL
ncbi:hypothetical protein MKW92_001013, partial [Papaver armeniacum]